MYRWLLCFRYLRTRYIALASIISVTLGVATLIVVNSVMAGFSAEMHERLHGLASDILIECHTSSGMPDPDGHLKVVREVVGDDLEGTSVSVHVPAMLAIDFNGQQINRHVNLVGIDVETYDDVSHFGRYLLHPENQEHASFELREDGYPDRDRMADWGWGYRRKRANYEQMLEAERQLIESMDNASQSSDATVSEGPSMGNLVPSELLGESDSEGAHEFDRETEQFPGIVLGIATCSTKHRDETNEVSDHFYCRPGDDVRMMFPNAADDTKVINQQFTVVDLYESGMSEYDSTFAFVQLDRLQDFRGMINPETGVRRVTTIQLKLAEGADLNAVRDALRRRFPPEKYAYNIQTWREDRKSVV